MSGGTNHNFFNRLMAASTASPSRPFLDGDSLITYAQADVTTAQLANLFTASGLQPGDRVLARTAKSPLALLVYLACLRGGFIYVPVNPACTRDELAYFLADTTPALFIGDADHVAHVAKNTGVAGFTLDASGEGTLADALAQQSPRHAAAVCHKDAIGVLIFTSGTTGAPKGAMLSHGNLAANAQTLYECWGWSTDDVLLHCLPIFHVHGLFVATHLAMLGGSRMIFHAGFDAASVLAALPQATVFMGVPTYYTRLLADPELTPATCSNMRLFVSGSAPLLEETFHAFRDRTGHTILERYGMSETGMLVSNPLDGQRLAGTVGYPLPGVQTRVCDAQGKVLPVGEVGVLQVQGPNVFSGYWGKPALNDSEFQDGWFITGDLVRQDADGRLAIVGRNKDMIISGGLNVYPKEIETVIDAQPGIVESAVFGVPHPDFGEGVVAAVIAAPGSNLDTVALLAACRTQLAGYKLPKAIVVLGQLPRNTMGKVQKNRLREDHANLFTAS